MPARGTRPWSLAARLTLRILAWLTLVWVLIIAGIYWHTRSHAYDLLDVHLQQTAILLARQPLAQLDEHELDQDDDKKHEQFAPRKKKIRSLAVYQAWQDGKLVARSPEAPSKPLTDTAAGFSDSLIAGREWRVYTAFGREHDVRVMVAEDVKLRREIVLGNVRTPLLGLLLAFPMLALLVWMTVRRAMRPVNETGALIRQRSPQSHAPLQVADAPREILPLIDALNQLFGRIGDLLHSERRFTADAAHELRTPIAAIRMMAQVAQGANDAGQRAEALQGVIQGCDRATRLVEQLLQLARLEADADAEQPLGDVLPSLQQVVDDLRRTHAAAHNQDLQFQAPGQLHARVAPALAGVLLRNLLDNALRYSPDGARVRVVLEQVPAERMQWTVEDSGPGMSDEDMQRLGERFFRVLGSGRSGSGLGWSIVCRIATLYGLHLQVDRSPELGGLRVRLTA